MSFRYRELKERQRAQRDSYPSATALRIHRALSWLRRAEQERETGDDDACFIFLWVAFNAAYASEYTGELSERQRFGDFIEALVRLDDEKTLASMVWDKFPGAIRVLINNPYVYQGFWDYRAGRKTERHWRQAFEKSSAAANRAIGQQNTGKLLAIVFDRLYTLRNQLLHGGATWNSRVNRDQLRDGVAILGEVVPRIIALMMQHPRAFDGEPAYPVVDYR